MKTTTKAKPLTAVGMYASRIHQARELAKRILAAIDDMPAPSESTDYADAGSAGRLVEMLAEVVDSM